MMHGVDGLGMKSGYAYLLVPPIYDHAFHYAHVLFITGGWVV